ncbi:hypothetical protein BABINDRAFT_161171 [Babjeviella inositovora NRRL Y-12698]|uniref:Zn(2)-C6 fungal-type domain-containing protein n=1 Tax=Babjeviella inositovora NRRL Y-12698 TaxID=984486 RepID=A0A1E3QR55_9ASCO|nr:uncharacterized protein BABINDRAFT_161171 [Babjeviella inositovora NRRL Y-12698]ODQ80196.1 hypothetical protein BABINDRAFT_161171 [Babjeviella inositovora NRRL Y-12698]
MPYSLQAPQLLEMSGENYESRSPSREGLYCQLLIDKIPEHSSAFDYYIDPSMISKPTLNPPPTSLASDNGLTCESNHFTTNSSTLFFDNSFTALNTSMSSGPKPNIQRDTTYVLEDQNPLKHNVRMNDLANLSSPILRSGMKTDLEQNYAYSAPRDEIEYADVLINTENELYPRLSQLDDFYNSKTLSQCFQDPNGDRPFSSNFINEHLWLFRRPSRAIAHRERMPSRLQGRNLSERKDTREWSGTDLTPSQSSSLSQPSLQILDQRSWGVLDVKTDTIKPTEALINQFQVPVCPFPTSNTSDISFQKSDNGYGVSKSFEPPLDNETGVRSRDMYIPQNPSSRENNRHSKMSQVTEEPVFPETSDNIKPVKRKRGRPPKVKREAAPPVAVICPSLEGLAYVAHEKFNEYLKSEKEAVDGSNYKTRTRGTRNGAIEATLKMASNEYVHSYLSYSSTSETETPKPKRAKKRERVTRKPSSEASSHSCSFVSLGSHKKRTIGPRSKTGCYTCRVRHKACPEERPECSQCARLGLTCDYSDLRPDYMSNTLLHEIKLREIKDVTRQQKKSLGKKKKREVSLV